MKTTIDDRAYQCLVEARERITPPGGWTRFSFHRGNAYCAVGAIEKSSGRGNVVSEEVYLYIGAAMRRILPSTALLLEREGPRSALMGYNDGHALHADVLALFDRAIAIAYEKTSFGRRERAFEEACCAAARRQREREAQAAIGTQLAVTLVADADLVVAGD